MIFIMCCFFLMIRRIPGSTRTDALFPDTRRFPSDNTVRVAIVGVGNCASSLVQGVQYYKDADENASVPGLMHVKFGKYHVRDVEFIAAFDVDEIGRAHVELQSLMRTSYAVFCLKNKNKNNIGDTVVKESDTQ